MSTAIALIRQRRQTPEALSRAQERGRGGCHVHQRAEQALQQEGALSFRRKDAETFLSLDDSTISTRSRLCAVLDVPTGP